MFNLLLIGCGYWGKNYIRIINELSDKFKLFAIIEVNQEINKNLKINYPQLLITNNINEVIDNIDCAIIATPINTHYEIAKYLIQKNKHILIEKPFTGSNKLSSEIISMIKNNIVMIGYTMPFIKGFDYLKNYIKGHCSDIKYIYAKRTNFGIIRKDCNVIYDLSCHDIAAVLYLLNEMPLWVNAVANNYINNDVYDIVFITLGFNNNIIFHLYTSWIDSYKQREFTVITDKYRISFNDIKDYPINICLTELNDKIITKDLEMIKPYIVWEEPLKQECIHFYNSINTQTASNNINPITDVNLGKNVDIILDKTMESIVTSCKVYL